MSAVAYRQRRTTRALRAKNLASSTRAVGLTPTRAKCSLPLQLAGSRRTSSASRAPIRPTCAQPCGSVVSDVNRGA
jgi:hypothetical protein